MILQQLHKKGLYTAPNFILSNTQYVTRTGSVAYGCSSDCSDEDFYGFCIPPLEMIFPHLAGEIEGFGRQKKRFEQQQNHHIEDKEEGKMYDITIFNIVKYFSLCMECNPNMLDTLFTPVNCIVHSTQISNLVRENRKIFLHKGAWPKFKGYAFSQLHKMSSKNPEEGSNRAELREKYGYDVKFGCHVVRLLLEVEMILAEGDLDIQRHKEQLKAIRRGEVKEEEIRQFFTEKEKSLEKLYNESKLPWGPDEDKIKKLLLNCLEMHYGNIDKCIVIPGAAENALKDIQEIMNKYNQTKIGEVSPKTLQ